MNTIREKRKYNLLTNGEAVMPHRFRGDRRLTFSVTVEGRGRFRPRKTAKS
jgi:hypothetical protein